MTTRRSEPIDGFSLAYDDIGSGRVVLLLHGWPGDRTDHRRLVPLLRDRVRLLVPDLRGFGESDTHPEPPEEAYSASARRAARSACSTSSRSTGSRWSATTSAAGWRRPWPGRRRGGWRAWCWPRRCPAWGSGCSSHSTCSPGSGTSSSTSCRSPRSSSTATPTRRAPTCARSGRTGPAPAVAPERRTTCATSTTWSTSTHRPGPFLASISWYRAGAGSVARARTESPPDTRSEVPLHAVVPHHDPLFPPSWTDRLGEWFAHVTLIQAPDAGHFVPLEAPEPMARAVLDGLDSW